ncbi:hypothetical protein J4462_02110 [Candidatus Pacearchaeota archaeon]|nr:hypothetical protein [Candidatus Pacearchaeota archaeon]
MGEQELERGRKYLLQFGRLFLEFLYRGRGNSPEIEEHWPYELITPLPPRSNTQISDSVLSLRIREGGFGVRDRIISLIPDENGMAYYPNIYMPVLDGIGFGAITTEQRERLIEEMREAGL